MAGGLLGFLFLVVRLPSRAALRNAPKDQKLSAREMRGEGLPEFIPREEKAEYLKELVLRRIPPIACALALVSAKQCQATRRKRTKS